MLADFPDPSVPPGGVGDRWFLYIGPAVIFLAVVFWVVLTLAASRIRPRSRHPRGGLPNRGPVQGGVIAGSPAQRSRRDPAPSVTHREVMAHIEQGRRDEEAAREEARGGRGGRPGGASAGTRRKPRKRQGLLGHARHRKPRS
ncbi:hypothetical protein [Actinomadura bangladeshensis]|uniref:Uncharacterized protein n=1 Tax=Actinomadura bangladeshensis TaxID=453573 RepID=A0A4R4N2M3_9ACTN|nr:hypothetical protein [Actinomadura bangladeshensis]TDC02971.1 hypothetical protein E1284_38930 [Actinomadura bangladeshensis]